MSLSETTPPSPTVPNPSKEVRGEKVHYETGAQRSSDREAVRYDLISPFAMRRLAATYAEGAAKYGARNWEKGMPESDLLNHAIAHIFLHLTGDKYEDHMAHAAWNLFAVMHFQEVENPLPT